MLHRKLYQALHNALFCSLYFSGLLIAAQPLLATTIAQQKTQRPDDFIDISKLIPQIQLDIRYYGTHNFIGEQITGYQAPLCLLTQAAANGLYQVEQRLLPMALTLKMYDCYRPQMAVDHFYRWSQQPTDIRMKTEFYPQLDKKVLFEQHYISNHSGHSRGSTVDLTIVPLNSQIPDYNPRRKQVPCTAAQSIRAPDNSLDFGTGYDCFSPLSHPDSLQVSPQARANRILLASLMEQAGFVPLETEWWHFTLKKEPYPDTYFNFPVK